MSQQGKIFIPKLTSHSGKHEDALRDELISRREKVKYEPLEQQKIENQLIMSRNRALKIPG